MSCPRIKLSISKTLIFDGVETGILLSDSAQQLHPRIPDVPDIYITLLEEGGISLTLILNQKAQAKEKVRAQSFSNIERQKLQRLHTQSGGAYGSVHNLVEASNLSVSKVGHFCIENLPIQNFFLPCVNSRE